VRSPRSALSGRGAMSGLGGDKADIPDQADQEWAPREFQFPAPSRFNNETSMAVLDSQSRRHAAVCESCRGLL
jgi:hypothetical protein